MLSPIGKRQNQELNELLQGNDPLREKREELRTALFGEDFYHITSGILEEIYHDMGYDF